MLGRSFAVASLALLVAGCAEIHSPFFAKVDNRTTSAVEIQLTVWRGDVHVFQANQTVGPSSNWRPGAFAEREGEYRIAAEFEGRVIAQDVRQFDRQDGPGGFVVVLDQGPARIDYWFN